MWWMPRSYITSELNTMYDAQPQLLQLACCHHIMMTWCNYFLLAGMPSTELWSKPHWW
jgi:hypothetical protein